MLKFRKNADNYDYDDEKYYPGENGGFDEEFAEAEDSAFGAAAPAPAEAAPSFGAPAVNAVKIVNPKEYKEAPEIANLLMNGNTVLLNIESIAKDQAISLLAYLAGAVHVSGGMMTKVSKTTLVLAPKNIDVSSIEAMVSDN